MNLFASGPGGLIQALFSLPLFSLLIGAVLAGVVAVRPRETAPGEPERYRRELRALGWAALAVIAVFALENIVRGYLVPLVDVVDWWRYPTPLLGAAVGLVAVLVLIVVRGTSAPEEPVIPTSPRNWTTFGSRAALFCAAGAIGMLVLTSVAAGLVSSADSDGRFIYLDLEAPNTDLDPLRPWFYGWSYGVPVIISAVLLALLAWAVLRANAARPFLRPDAVPTERRARARIANAVSVITAAAALLALAGAFRFIARSGSISRLTVGDGPEYEIVWRYAALAEAAGWLAPALEIVAFGALLLVAARTLTRRTRSTAARVDEVAR